MVKRRQQQSIKKTKPTTGNRSKSVKGKKVNQKHGTKKHTKSAVSKRSVSPASSSSSSIKKHGHQKIRKQKGKTPSKFNLYMKTTVPQIKQDHPGISQKDAFKKAAEQWTESPDNPKNKHH
ncbi:unnamed protein product [Rotaria sordida]|uniref:YABBY protein C-terminal domain-containing protein n=1 Tax=Rotaria sordida TaxID=392033 RepID=A0A814LB64_9BILA|nr:unnamed protein product [Rotaria sordida]CAF1062711.1 unnamed protein product [Rotaria sordida]CAF1090631.1 unnamed protein product [Rotaria sordida]CAF3577028.1 unnamed protein product [Rotaria sordida]CAF3987622.1 unnamed protein product [Rotaria sordida]